MHASECMRKACMGGIGEYFIECAQLSYMSKAAHGTVLYNSQKEGVIDLNKPMNRVMNG